VQIHTIISERNGSFLTVFPFGRKGCFTSFLAQTEEAQDCHYDHNDADDVENVHCRGSLVKNYDKNTQLASKFLHQNCDHQRSPLGLCRGC
jgi:hypothetical protein